jgi:hypothetical protein
MREVRLVNQSTKEAVPEALESPSRDEQNAQVLGLVEPKTKPVWARWAKRVIVMVIATFVGLTLYKLGRAFNLRDLHFRLWPILLATLVLVFANFAQAMAWVKLLERLVHRPVRTIALCSVYCAGQLARYTPGKVALLVVRVAGAKRLGLEPRLVASSVGIEVLSWMTVGTLLGSLAVGVSDSQSSGISALLSRYSMLVASGVILAILILLFVERSRFPKFLLRAIRAEGSGPILSWSVLLWQALSWSGCVAQALLLPVSVGYSAEPSLLLVGIFILAPIAGFLAMVAPGGLGVREAFLSFALSSSLGPTRALSVALLARGVYIVSEIIAWVVSRLVERKRVSLS